MVPKDPSIFKLIAKEKQRQTQGVELIASENYVSDAIMKAMGSILTNKYAEGLPKKDTMVDVKLLMKLSNWLLIGLKAYLVQHGLTYSRIPVHRPMLQLCWPV